MSAGRAPTPRSPWKRPAETNPVSESEPSYPVILRKVEPRLARCARPNDLCISFLLAPLLGAAALQALPYEPLLAVIPSEREPSSPVILRKREPRLAR